MEYLLLFPNKSIRKNFIFKDKIEKRVKRTVQKNNLKNEPKRVLNMYKY